MSPIAIMAVFMAFTLAWFGGTVYLIDHGWSAWWMVLSAIVWIGVGSAEYKVRK